MFTKVQEIPRVTFSLKIVLHKMYSATKATQIWPFTWLQKISQNRYNEHISVRELHQDEVKTEIAFYYSYIFLKNVKKLKHFFHFLWKNGSIKVIFSKNMYVLMNEQLKRFMY